MKHVWIFNHYAVEPGGVGGTRHYNLARSLPAFGWTASIIAASVELNTGRQRLHAREKVRLDEYENIPFLWIRTPRYRGNGARRIFNMLAYTIRVLFPSYVSGLVKPDVIIGSSVHPFAALSAALLARRYKVPFVFEVRDLWPQTLVDFGRLRGHSLMTSLLRKLELWLYHHACRIIVLLPRAGDYIATLGISKQKVVWISNGVNLSEFPISGPREGNRAASFTLMYFGAHGQANALDTLIKAMACVRQKAMSSQTIRLRMIGDGPLKPELQKLSISLGLDDDWVSFEPPVLKQDIPRVAAAADALVIAVRDMPQLYKYGISMNKLFEYMASAKPMIIASAAINNPVEDAQCGITVAPENPEALADAITTMASLPLAERRAMGERGRHHVEGNYSYQKLAESLAVTLDECVAEWGLTDGFLRV